MHTSSFLSVFAAFFLLPTINQAQPVQPKRPMTFEDMMRMKRLGATAVSPDGKWLGYGVTTVDLGQNQKNTELWLQAIAPTASEGSDPMKLSVARPGDGGIEFSPDGKRILFLSRREGGQQIWLADFDPATGATSNVRKLTAIWAEADNAKWSPDGHSVVFTSGVYPDCPPITTTDFDTGNKCNTDRDAAQATSKVKAQIFTHLLYRHWDRFTGDKRSHLFLVSVETGAMRDLNPGDTHDVPPFSLEGPGCGCDFAPDSKELAYTDNIDPVQAISVSARIFTLGLTDPAAKPVQVSTSAGGNFSPAYSPDGKYLAWRSQARAGYESDKFRLILYDRKAKTTTDLMPNFDNWVDEFAWGPNSHNIYFVSGNHGEEDIYIRNPQSGEPALVASGAEFSDLRLFPVKLGRPTVEGAEGMLATMMKVDRPSEVVYAFGHNPCPPEGQPGFDAKCDSIPPVVTHLNDTLLAQLDLPKMESFWFTAKDGTKLEGFLIRPPGFDPAKKYPVSSSYTAGRRATGATTGATAGTPNSLPPTATWSS